MLLHTCAPQCRGPVIQSGRWLAGLSWASRESAAHVGRPPRLQWRRRARVDTEFRCSPRLRSGAPASEMAPASRAPRDAGTASANMTRGFIATPTALNCVAASSVWTTETLPADTPGDRRGPGRHGPWCLWFFRVFYEHGLIFALSFVTSFVVRAS